MTVKKSVTEDYVKELHMFKRLYKSQQSKITHRNY
jgi:hypothetical protein